MSTEAAWPVLNVAERRVLGVMVEKAKTTPDNYPLSLNALVTGSNQKSNREPILNLSDTDVEDALATLKQKALVFEITGQGRVAKWRHGLYEAWKVDKVELAILGELLLRGPQTEGELRTRASRMEPIADLDTLRNRLRPLAERGLATYLSPEGKRGTTLTHGFHEARELEQLRSTHGAEAAAVAAEISEPTMRSVTPNGAAETTSGLAEAQKEIVALKAGLEEVRAMLTRLSGEVRQLREALGVPEPPAG